MMIMMTSTMLMVNLTFTNYDGGVGDFDEEDYDDNMILILDGTNGSCY